MHHPACMNHYKSFLTSVSVSNFYHYSLLKTESILNSTLNIHWKDCCWIWSSNTLATWCKELTHWKRPWCWERLKAEREGGDRGWDGWVASLTQWTWVWASYRSWWWTGKPGMLQSMGLQRVGPDWTTDWTELNWTSTSLYFAKCCTCIVSFTPGNDSIV